MYSSNFSSTISRPRHHSSADSFDPKNFSACLTIHSYEIKVAESIFGSKHHVEDATQILWESPCHKQANQCSNSFAVIFHGNDHCEAWVEFVLQAYYFQLRISKTVRCLISLGQLNLEAI